MSINDVMSRLAALEANDRHAQKHRETVDAAIMNISTDIRDIRDVIIASNLAEIPKRVSNLEKWQWTRNGAIGVLSAAITLSINWVMKK